jgi:hypothetical protein
MYREGWEGGLNLDGFSRILDLGGLEADGEVEAWRREGSLSGERPRGRRKRGIEVIWWEGGIVSRAGGLLEEQVGGEDQI